MEGIAGATLGTILGSGAGWSDNANSANHPSTITASITDSSLQAGGALTVQAVAAETVTSTVTNVSEAKSTASGGATAVAVGGLVASNRVSRAASAFIDEPVPTLADPDPDPVVVTGAILVSAQNGAAIAANSTLTTSAVASSTGAQTTCVSNQAPGNAGNSNSTLAKTTTLTFGDTVLYKATYSTADQAQTLKTGDTVFVAPGYTGKGTTDQVYQYKGTGGSVDLGTADYTDTSAWTPISAVEGAVYKFMGASGAAVDLATGLLYDADSGAAIENPTFTTAHPQTATDSNYYDLGYWQPVPKAQVKPADANDQTGGSASGASVGGVVVLNEIHGGASAAVTNATVTGLSLSVLANDAETITATLDATATTSTSSSFGGGDGTSLAVGGSIAINEIIGGADAHVAGSKVTTTGDVDVEATNTSTITATTASAVTVTSGVAVGVILADNTIGAAFQNLLSMTVDTLAGGDELGNAAPAGTTAYVLNSMIDSQHGGVTVSATSTETIAATVTNAATAAIEPGGSSSYSATAVLTDNQVMADVKSYVAVDASGSASDTVTAMGAVSISATDTASITATSSMTALGTAAASGPANDYAKLALQNYKYTNLSTDASHKVTLDFGDLVAVEQSDGTIKVYEYLGTTRSAVDLSKLTDATNSIAFGNLEYWKPISADQLAKEAETQSANPKSGEKTGETVEADDQKSAFTSNPSSNSFYVLFDYNNVRSSTESYISNASVTAGGVAVLSTDAASISATNSSTVTTVSGGLGVGGMVTTNHVQGDAKADIEHATVAANAATAGNVSVDAENTSAITASDTTALTADGNAVSFMAAFNVIGWANDNFGTLALGTLVGDSLLGSATPDQTLAIVDGASTVTAAGDVTVKADGAATITATVGNQAKAGNGDATATVSVGGVIASNKINTATEAYVGTSPDAVATAISNNMALDTSSVTATAGMVTVSATDRPTLSASNSITVSAAAATGGVASALSGDYRYTDKSGSQTVKKGDKVLVLNAGATHLAAASSYTVYTYAGTDKTSAVSLADSDQNYATDTNDWTAAGDGSAPSDSSNAESKAVGAVFVLNDVRGHADAEINVAANTAIAGGAGVSVTANEAASIAAFTQSNLTSSGGGNGSSGGNTTSGGGLAVGGAIDTNLVLGNAQASIRGATLSAGGGGILVDAKDTAQVDAETLVASGVSGAGSQTSVGLSMAFNSIGYAPENFLFNLVDDLVGGDYLSNPTPDDATAFVTGVTVTGDAGGFSVTAESDEQVNATVSNAATSTTSDLYEASSKGFGGVFASNKVAGSAIAYVDSTVATNGATSTSPTIAGALVVQATDTASITSNVKLVSSAIVTSDGGTGALDLAIANGASNPTYTANPSEGAAYFTTVNPGDTVQLGANYDTATLTIGSITNPTSVTLTSGEVIADTSGKLYRYLGSGGTFNLTDATPVTSDTTDFKVVGGTAGATYAYAGTTAATIDLNDTDYTDTTSWNAPRVYYSAPSSGTSNAQTLNPGDRAFVAAGYDTPTYTVGKQGASASQELNAGAVVADGSTLYRYIGTAQNYSVNLTSAEKFEAATDFEKNFAKIGGQQGTAYIYVGAAGSVDLENTNYADPSLWRPASAYSAVPAGGALKNTQTLYYGDQVTLGAGYDDPDYTVDSANPLSTTLRPGDVISDGGTLYRYVGTSSLTGVNLTSHQAFTSSGYSAANFHAIGGKEGETYEYLGAPAASDRSAAGASRDLFNQNYADPTLWKSVSTPNGAPNGLSASSDASSNNSSKTPSSATAVGGVLVLNDVRSATQAYVQSSTIDANSATVKAVDNATIDATNDSTVVAVGSQQSAAGGDDKAEHNGATSLAVNAIIATNVVQSSATAYVNESAVTAEGTLPTGITSAISIDAENTSKINASTAAQTSSSGTAAGIVLAFNSIGYQASNVLFNAFDALLESSKPTELLNPSAASPETDVDAYAQDSTLTANDGAASVTATLNATIDAMTTNATSSLAAGLDNAKSTAVGAILATNKINDSAHAYVTTSATAVTPAAVAASGAVTIEAFDKSEIDAIDTQSASATVQSSGAAGSDADSLLSQYAAQMANGYQYTRNSGTQIVAPGQIAFDGSRYYIFLGTPNNFLGMATGEVSPVWINFGTVDFSLTDLTNDPLNKPVWAPFSNSSLLQYAPQVAEFVTNELSPPAATTEKPNPTAADAGTGSRSTGVGAIFVLNTIDSSTTAYESTAPTRPSGSGATSVQAAGAIAISATNISSITAKNTSTVTTGPSSPSSSGGGVAVNGIVATNNILGDTRAYADGGTLTANGTAGSFAVTALSEATIDAENDATTDGATTSVGVVLAFNTIGIPQPVTGFLENTVDALFGFGLAGTKPDTAYAYIDNATVTADKGVSVTATESSTITASISNSEVGLFSSGTSVAATMTLNEVATDAEAWIAGGTTTATAGDIDIKANGQSTITSTVTSPVVKLAVNFTPASNGGSQSQNAETVGVAIARNIIDNTLAAMAGQSAASVTVASPAAWLDAEDGNVKITADQESAITATSAAAAVSVKASGTSGSSQSFAGGGAVAVNTILGGVAAASVNSTLKAAGAGGIAVEATYGGSITATVAALSAAVAASDGASNAVAIGAAVSLNLIGWRGAVADETQDSKNPITLSAAVNRGSLTAGGLVKVDAASTAIIKAMTAAASVAVSVSTGGGSNSGEEGSDGKSPTNANEEGEGKIANAKGGESPTDMGEASGTTVDEGADVPGGSETNQGEKGGAGPARRGTPQRRRAERARAARPARIRAWARAAAC